MNLLLDTHTLIWAAIEPQRLSSRVRGLLVDPAHSVAVSALSFWEISLKHGLGKIELRGCTPEDLPDAAREMAFEIVAPTAEECASVHHLPRLAHKNPFDRLLVWTCLQRQATLVSKDAALRKYEAHGLKLIW